VPLEPDAASDLERAAAVFAGVRPRLFGIAYRMLASSAEAEDIVQEVWLRWQAYDRSSVRDAGAFLATVTTRLSINAAQTARVRHETYIGPWLPEPVDTGADPALGAERGEALEFALLLLLEKLSPPQRAAYVLREAFDYPYDQIADLVQLSEANVRQLVSRARKRLAADRREQVGAGEQRRLLAAFLEAAQDGDFSALEELFAEDVVSYSDGGGVVRATRIPVLGRTRVAKFITAFAPRFWTDSAITWVEANGQASVLISRAGTVFALVTISASAGGIDHVLWMMNPSKLAGIARLLPGASEEPVTGRDAPLS
jgi:RNA polymerase sigma-70 factor, ECF subfamily